MDQSLLPLWQARSRRAAQVAAVLRGVPFVRLVGLNGSLVTNRMRPGSDIDFYIVTAKNRLYLTRLLVTAAVQLTGWRRYGRKVRGRVCLNRFATVEALEITPHDDYHARVFSRLAPLVAIDGTYQQYQAANKWMAELGYPLKRYRPQPLRFGWRSAWRLIGEGLWGGRWGDRLERSVGHWQRHRIEHDPRSAAPDSLVRVRKNELCFHFIPKKSQPSS